MVRRTYREASHGAGSPRQRGDGPEAIFFPVGAEGVAEVYYGPADYVETANTIGLPRYVNNWALNPRARHVEVQMNVLPVWRKPAALRRAIGNA